jgi:hypothetical protein
MLISMYDREREIKSLAQLFELLYAFYFVSEVLECKKNQENLSHITTMFAYLLIQAYIALPCSLKPYV